MARCSLSGNKKNKQSYQKKDLFFVTQDNINMVQQMLQEHCLTNNQKIKNISFSLKRTFAVAISNLH